MNQLQSLNPSASPPTRVWSLAKPLGLHYAHQDLYAELHHASYAYDLGCYRLQASGHIQFDKLLNLFALKTWKTLTSVTDFQVSVTYSGGGARLLIMGHDGADMRLISAHSLENSAHARTVSFSVPPEVSDQLIVLRVEAERKTDVFDIAFTTSRPPRAEVKLGIVITTFNRPEDVEAQVAVLESLRLSGLTYEVLVVDNGSNLTFARSYANTSIISAPNLGGAGGFTRGLTELMSAGRFTHAMFMDDDAFCHPEAIVRAVNLIRYSTDKRLALSGAMNYLHAPAIQYELGGRITDYGVGSIRMNVDANNARAALDNQAALTPAYGAWWCFIFPLHAVSVLPFPFFVRGDDIAFSLQNRFNLQTMPGLLAWQPSFEFKIGAPVEYLAHRSFLTLPLLVKGKWKKAAVLNGVRHAFALEVDGLRYPIAEGICDALEDVLTGPAFWANAANTVARLQDLGRLEKDFSTRSVLPNWIYKPHDGEARRSMRVLRARFGHINLPGRLCWRRPVLTNDMAPRRGQAAFRRGMIYFAPDNSRSLSCARDWRWRRRVQRRFRGLITEYDRRFDELTKAYATGQSGLQSLAAWRSRFAGHYPEVKRAHSAV